MIATVATFPFTSNLITLLVSSDTAIKSPLTTGSLKFIVQEELGSLVTRLQLPTIPPFLKIFAVTVAPLTVANPILY